MRNAIDLNKLQELRRNGYTFSEISKKTGLNRKVVWRHTHTIPFSKMGSARHEKLNGIVKQIKGQSKFTSRKARIISHLFFDGSLFRTKAPKSYHRVARYINSSKKLINEFEKDIWFVYGLKPTSKNFDGKVWRISFSSKKLFEDLSKYSPSYSTSNSLARIPVEIMNGTRKMKLELLRAFWNDEGSISSEGRLSADTRSKTIMQQLVKLHKEFGFIFNIVKYVDLRRPVYKIYLFKTRKNLEKFVKLQLFTYSIVARGKGEGKTKFSVVKDTLRHFKTR